MAQTTTLSRRIVTIRRLGAECANFRSGGVLMSVPLWTGAVYEARARQDGVVTWRLIESFGRDVSGREPSMRFEKEIRAEAARRGLPYVEGVRHGQRAPS